MAMKTEINGNWLDYAKRCRFPGKKAFLFPLKHTAILFGIQLVVGGVFTFLPVAIIIFFVKYVLFFVTTSFTSLFFISNTSSYLISIFKFFICFFNYLLFFMFLNVFLLLIFTNENVLSDSEGLRGHHTNSL